MNSFYLVAIPASAAGKPFESELLRHPDPYVNLDPLDKMIVPQTGARTTGCELESESLKFTKEEMFAHLGDPRTWLWCPDLIENEVLVNVVGRSYFYRNSQLFDTQSSFYQFVNSRVVGVAFQLLNAKQGVVKPDSWLNPLVVRMDLNGSSLAPTLDSRPFSEKFGHEKHGLRSQILGEGKILLVSPLLDDLEYVGACFLHRLYLWRREQKFPENVLDSLFSVAGLGVPTHRDTAILAMAYYALGGSAWIEPSATPSSWQWLSGEPTGINGIWLANWLGKNLPANVETNRPAEFKKGRVQSVRVLGGDIRDRRYQPTRTLQAPTWDNANLDLDKRPLWSTFSALAATDNTYIPFVQALQDLWDRRQKEPAVPDSRAYFWSQETKLECDVCWLVDTCLGVFLRDVNWMLSYAKMGVSGQEERHVNLLKSGHLAAWSWFRRMTTPSILVDSLSILKERGWWERLDEGFYSLIPGGTVSIESRKFFGTVLGTDDCRLGKGVLGRRDRLPEETNFEFAL